jgi:hypothetical protein
MWQKKNEAGSRGHMSVSLLALRTRTRTHAHTHTHTNVTRRHYTQCTLSSHVWLRTGRPGFDPRQGQRIFRLTSASRPAVGPTQLPVKWVPGAISAGVKRGRGVMLTTHPLLVPGLRKSRSCTCCHPDAPLWSVTGPLYLFYLIHSALNLCTPQPSQSSNGFVSHYDYILTGRDPSHLFRFRRLSEG